jgi:hypothetical protein
MVSPERTPNDRVNVAPDPVPPVTDAGFAGGTVYVPFVGTLIPVITPPDTDVTVNCAAVVNVPPEMVSVSLTVYPVPPFVIVTFDADGSNNDCADPVD